ncbi:MAG: DUF6785 family protein [Candidatus Poribacteria bacterium]|nr:DUF6785 family protein [Candidatus Poribacteria bacterium]
MTTNHQKATKRSIFIGILLIPLSSFWITNSEMVTGVTEITSTSLLIGAVFVLFLLVLVNVLLEKIVPKHALSGAEMLVIFVMLSIGMSINGIGMFGFLVTALCNPFWYATPENGWHDFFPEIPNWFVPQSKDAIQHLYLGESTLYRSDHLKAWVIPILVWSTFTFVLLWVMLCVNILLRKRWLEHEQLSFPITTLPVEMSLRERRFSDYLKNRYLWIGLVIATLIQTNNTLQYYYPQLPYIKVKPFDISHLFNERPWNAVAGFPIAFHPCVIGLTYFIPLDISFSCWFFFLFRKGQQVLAAAISTGGGSVWGPSGRYPAIAEQGVGAWIGLALLALWIGRKHLAQTLSFAWSGKPSDEPIHQRYAWLGLTLGIIALVAFCSFAGLNVAIATIFILLFLLYMIGLTRIRSEGGVIWNFGPYINPPQLMVHLVGSRLLNPRDLTILAYLQWFNLDYRCAVMPHQLEGLRIAHVGKVQRKSMFRLIVLAMIVGIVAAYWNVLRMYYIKGAGTPYVNLWRTNMGLIPYRQLRAWLDYPADSGLDSLPFISGGMLATFLLMFLRTNFLWWPIHPIGYAVGHSFIIDLIWTPMCVSWCLKKIVLQCGGIRAYRQAMPFFIGLLLGDYLSGCTFSLIGVIFDIPMYRVFPN